MSKRESSANHYDNDSHGSMCSSMCMTPNSVTPSDSQGVGQTMSQQSKTCYLLLIQAMDCRSIIDVDLYIDVYPIRDTSSMQDLHNIRDQFIGGKLPKI
ncbi:MAG: hypothetical protein GY928_37095 [Colwellia sp.]|nr:hypothetical protein [Colwellia sp.]